MKKYIIFANSISGIGGAQLYILRKMKYLLDNGFDAFLVVGNADKIGHEELKKFKTCVIPQLFYPPNLFNNKKRNEIIINISKFINYNNSDKLYIESHQTAPALWGEIFSHNVNSINIVYALAPFGVKRRVYKIFFKEKLKREQFIGCNESFIRTNFPNFIGPNNYMNIPFNKDEIIMSGCHKLKKETFDLNILTISRIDKTYIKSSLLDLIKYTELNQDAKIKYDIYVDKILGKKFDELRNIIDSNKQKNLKINLYGPVYPLNNCLYKNQDIFIGMGTSILNSASMGLPSLVVDYRNNKYYGFFGRDHYEFGYNEDKASNELAIYLDNFIKNKENRKELADKAYSLFCTDFESSTVNYKFIEFIKEKYKTKLNYINIPSGIFDARDLLDFILIKLFGLSQALIIRRKIIIFLSYGKKGI